jgi:serine/threonine-protein kinase
MASPQQRYRVLERIAAGGMAEVFRAESAGLEGFKKTVAIKRVLPHLSEKKQFIGMFLDEARLSASLSHSNCVQVFDIGVGDNTYFIVMEYVDGADLKTVVEYQKQQNTRLAIEASCFVCLKICEGLSYAHEMTDSKGRKLNIVHRDVSPPNVLITRFGEIKVVDFGLAKANSQLERSEPGIIKGKFSYLSPEAAHGEEVDARADVFAVGVMLWELLAGRRLFLGDTDLQTVRMVQAAQVPSIRQIDPNVPETLERVLAKALAADRNKRYQSAAAFGRDLNAIMFAMGRAISSFDIAKYVNDAVAQRVQKKATTDKRSLIGNLIEDAMMEFSSLQSDASEAGTKVVGGGTKAGAAPVKLGSFEDVQDWTKDIGTDGDAPESRPAFKTKEYAAGNLAALEDDGLQSGRPSLLAAPTPSPPPAAAEPLSTPEPSDAEPSSAAGSGGSKMTVVAIIVIALSLALLAAAYFSGRLPLK